MTKGKKGGALMNDVADLAVPFALLLAKSGLDALYKSKSKAATASKPRGKRAAKNTQKGGNNGCIAGQIAGSNSSRGHVINEFQRLTNEIQELLKVY